MLIESNDKNIEQSIEKVYALRSKRRTKNGEEYIYKNYRVFIPYKYIETMNMSDQMFLYSNENKIYATSVQPDGRVRAKRLSVHSQRGSTNRKSSKAEESKRKWKKFFTIPRFFFPDITENNKVVFSLDTSKVEQFSNINATLTIDLIN